MMVDAAGNRQRCDGVGRSVSGGAGGQSRRIGQGRAASKLRIARAKLAGCVRGQALVAAVLFKHDMAGGMRSPSGLREQEGENQQKCVQDAAHAIILHMPTKTRPC